MGEGGGLAGRRALLGRDRRRRRAAALGLKEWGEGGAFFSIFLSNTCTW